MNYRTAELLAATDVGASGTKLIDLNIADIISRIVIRWQVTKASSSMYSYAHKDITKIELVDGSEVLHSLNGGQNQALCIFDRKAPTMLEGGIINANAQISYYGIDFGRFLHDPQLAFDPKKFKNPQLKISYNEAVSDETATANEMEVWAECFDEKIPSPMGFLSAKEHYNYTPSASGVYEYIELPTDYPLRKMLIQGYLKAYEPWNQVSNAKLDEDNDKRILFDWNMEKYYQVRKCIDAPISEVLSLLAHAQAIAFYLTPSDYWASLMLTPRSATASYRQTQPGKGGYFVPYSETAAECSAVATGWLPNHCFQFPFGDQMDMDDWYDVTRVGSLRLRLKSGGGYSGSNVGVILQQVRNY